MADDTGVDGAARACGGGRRRLSGPCPWARGCPGHRRLSPRLGPPPPGRAAQDPQGDHLPDQPASARSTTATCSSPTTGWSSPPGRHTRTMLAQDCFRHRCEGEPGLHRRVKRSGYTKGRRSWGFAEILGYENTPRQMIGRWMHSRFNRRNGAQPRLPRHRRRGRLGSPRGRIETTASSPPTRSSSAGASRDARRIFDPRHAWRRRRLDALPGCSRSRSRMVLRIRKIVFVGSLALSWRRCSFSPGL